jgi:hypothetical protein
MIVGMWVPSILSEAAKYSNTLSSESTVRMLLRCGADPNKSSFDMARQKSTTPISCAMECINTTSTPETCNILQTRGVEDVHMIR